MLSSPRHSPPRVAPTLAAFSVLAVLWVFWPTILAMSERWADDPRYSHGYLVPVFSGYLLWFRRSVLEAGSPRPSRWGFVVLFTGLAVRFLGTLLYYDWFAEASLVVCLLGLAMIHGGRTGLRWAWPSVAFLVFMMPLPYGVEVALARPLQRIATVASTYSLQTLGFFAVSEGNTIRMGEVRLGVVEACSGLSMLLIFFALSTAVAVVARRPWYEKVLLVASAVPVALISNVTRIVVTGVLHKTVGSEMADYVFHDLAGWLMMPFALALFWLELKVFSWVVVERTAEQRRPAFLAGV